jgi:hypothetical protein
LRRAREVIPARDWGAAGIVTSKFFEVVLTPARSWPMITTNDCSYRAARRGHFVGGARI